MNNRNTLHYFMGIFFIITVILLTIFPTQAKAALTIISVIPNTISNRQNNTITVSGNDFVSGSIISLGDYGPLSTSYFSDTTLFAVIPNGVAVGTHTITVINPDSTFTSLDNALTITSDIPVATATETSEPPNRYERPVLVVEGYSISQDTISPGDYFIGYITLYNAGQHYARNIVANFTPGDLIPRETGGVVAVGEIAPGNHLDFAQPFILSSEAWKYVASINMQVAYSDEAGMLYNETFVISLPILLPYTSGATATPTPTSTPTTSVKPQLVITNYTTDVSPLQPGIQFTLSLNIQNMGAATAKRVTMIVGGGGISGGSGGTQEPGGGISGASGEFSNFAPIGSSNVQSLGEFNPGMNLSARQSLIVNTSLNPGAYPLKISFVYLDEQNHSYTDDQVVTLLVYRLPSVDINFYQELPPLYIGQMNMLPLQVVNLGRNSVVLGTMRVNGGNGQFTNNSIMVGALEPGGYFTLDAGYMPDQPGPVDLLISIEYTNDFNQSQVISKTIAVDVMEQPIIEPPIDGGPNGGPEVMPPQSESFVQKVWRFILGLIGLDSGISNPHTDGGLPPIETQVPGEKPIIVPAQPIKGP